MAPAASAIVDGVDLTPRAARHLLQDLPLPLRYGVVGAVVLGLAGAITGLVVGVRVYWPTAWAAAIEVGVPATFVGFALGLVTGALVRAFHRVHQR